MASIGDTTRPEYIYDQATDTWIPVGIGPHSHTPAAIGAISNTLTTTTGDLIYAASANTPARLGVGTTGQVLTVASGLPSWATATSGGMTQLGTPTTLSGASTTISSIDQTYKDLQIVIYGWQGDTSNVRNYLRLNGISTSTYRVVYAFSYQTANQNFSPTSAILTNNTNTGSAVNTMVVTIPNYASTAITKVANFYGFNYDNGTPSFESYNGVASTEISGAITSLVFSRGSGNLTAGTVLVYGVK